MVIQVDAPITVAKEAGVDWFYEGPQDLLELTVKKKNKKKSFLIIGNWNEKVGSQNTQNDGKVWPLSTKRSRAKADRVLSIENTGHIKHHFQATQGITLHICLNGLPWKPTEIILSFLRLHPSTAFLTLLLAMRATPFLLSDSCPQ